MALTDKQKLGKCCGIFCSFLACLNIWFFLMITIFQTMDSPYMKIELEGFTQASDDSSNWTVAFIITVVLNVLCMVGCFACTKLGCYKDTDEVRYYKGRAYNNSRDINTSEEPTSPRNDKMMI